MPKSVEMAHAVLCIVADEFEVSADDIRSHVKTAEIVDARHTAIKLMYQNGMYAPRIARIFGCSVRNINYVITSYENRLKSNNLIRINYERTRKKLKNIVEEKV